MDLLTKSFMQFTTLPQRSTTIIGPYLSDMVLKIKRIGENDEGMVHQLCAPIIYDYDNHQSKLTEVCTLPNTFIIRRNKMYLLASFVSCVEYGIKKF